MKYYTVIISYLVKDHNTYKIYLQHEHNFDHIYRIKTRKKCTKKLRMLWVIWFFYEFFCLIHFFNLFLLLFKYSCLHFHPTTIPAPPIPPSHPSAYLLWPCPCVLYTCSFMGLLLLSPIFQWYFQLKIGNNPSKYYFTKIKLHLYLEEQCFFVVVVVLKKGDKHVLGIFLCVQSLSC